MCCSERFSPFLSPCRFICYINNSWTSKIHTSLLSICCLVIYLSLSLSLLPFHTLLFWIIYDKTLPEMTSLIPIFVWEEWQSVVNIWIILKSWNIVPIASAVIVLQKVFEKSELHSVFTLRSFWEIWAIAGERIKDPQPRHGRLPDFRICGTRRVRASSIMQPPKNASSSSQLGPWPLKKAMENPP